MSDEIVDSTEVRVDRLFYGNTRLRNILQEKGVRTVDQLLELSYKDFMELSGVGQKTFAESLWDLTRLAKFEILEELKSDEIRDLTYELKSANKKIEQLNNELKQKAELFDEIALSVRKYKK